MIMGRFNWSEVVIIEEEGDDLMVMRGEGDFGEVIENEDDKVILCKGEMSNLMC